MLLDEQKNQTLTQLVFDPKNQPSSGESFQHDESSEMVVVIQKLIGGTPGFGYKPGPQKLLCKCLFLKVYGALLWHKFVDITKRTLKVASVNEEFKGMSRQVAVLALEYVNGVCMQELFDLSGPVEVVKLIAKDQNPASFETDLNQRLELMAQLMNGTLTQEKAGLDHCDLRPRNVIVTMETKKARPRAVLVGYGNAIVDELRQQPAEAWKYFPNKAHPNVRFGWSRLEPFEGRVSSERRSPEEKADGSLLPLGWMIKKFGGLINNPNYTVFPKERMLEKDSS
ncbi:hypothetical protein LZ31DRAFT_585771 [Colletotrichum somersetense]|nr:hypothetical protein LZ31DRAFT_585771 [Colletotrichum somersetense]